MPPLVSICLPLYNGERFLPEAIESALAQSFADFELLIADDASTDRSLEIAQAYAQRDKRILVWRNEANKGLFANYNECMKRAQGKLVKLFAQDDLMDARLLETEVSAFTSDPTLSLVAVQRQWIDASGIPLPLESTFDRTTRMPGNEVVQSCLLRRFNMIGEPSTVMFPRANIGSGFDCSYYHLGDLEFWFRLLEKGDYLYIHEPLCSFRRHEASTTDKNIKGLLFALDLIELANQYADRVAGSGLTKHDLKLATAYDAATFIHKLFLEGEVSLDELLANKQPEQMERQLDQFKELAFYALLSGAASRATLQDHADELERQCKQVQQQLDGMTESTLWKSTNFLRSAVSRFKS
jgi:glycosyltransferase involved in cell wall biosynthesis